MTPCFSFNDAGYGAVVNVEKLSNLFVGKALNVEFSYLHHVVLSENGPDVTFSTRTPSFRDHVGTVPGRWRSEEMPNLKTHFPITIVACEYSLSWISVKDSECFSMNVKHLAVVFNKPIAIGEPSKRPIDARVGFPWSAGYDFHFGDFAKKKCVSLLAALKPAFSRTEFQPHTRIGMFAKLTKSCRIRTHLRPLQWGICSGPLPFARGGPFVYFTLIGVTL